MLRKNNGKQDKIIVATLETLMPQDHFLRDLERYVDFSFIYDKVSYLYSNTGRPSVDPVVLVKMLLLGFLYGIDSERKLEREVTVNIAYRWFLGINLDEPVPGHSTISQTRRRKWRDTNVFEDIFTEIVQKCMEVGLLDGTLILTDSTHIKANAANNKRETITITLEPSEYMRKLDKLCEQELLKLHADKPEKSEKLPKPLKSRDIEKSTTDPDSGVLKRPGKPNGFHYLNHQSVDGKSGIITDVFVTPANINDCEPYVDRIKYQINKYGFPVSEVGLDSGYDYAPILKEMYDLGIKTYAPVIDMEKRWRHRIFPPSAFEYDKISNVYICPNGCKLKYSTADRHERKKVYRASKKDCNVCPVKSKCIGGKSIRSRTIAIPFFKEILEKQRANYGTNRYYEVQRKRAIYCEGNFALQKDNHNLRRTRKRGNANVTEHCLCSALALNLKRLVKHLKDKDYPREYHNFCSIPAFLQNLFPIFEKGFEFLLKSSLFRPLCQHDHSSVGC